MGTFDSGLLIFMGIIVIVLFIVMRWVMLWYYKINDRIVLMEQNNELLKELIKHFTWERISQLLKEKKGLFVEKRVIKQEPEKKVE